MGIRFRVESLIQNMRAFSVFSIKIFLEYDILLPLSFVAEFVDSFILLTRFVLLL